jgi:predicted nucleic acid-binding protein
VLVRDQAIVDSDIVIKLARLELLDRLLRLFDVVHVPTAVARETRLYGRRRRRPDVNRFRRRCRRCSEKHPLVLQAMRGALHRADPSHRHAGEAEAIAQAEALGVRVVLLTDDREATRLAAERGIEVIASPSLLFRIAELAR